MDNLSDGKSREEKWKQHHKKPIEIIDQKMFDKVLEHIHLNPVMLAS
jgi:ribosomal protein S25